MMSTGLNAAMTSLGAEGVAVICSAAAQMWTHEPDILHRAGMIGFPSVTANNAA